jgi:hypothetical protein
VLARPPPARTRVGITPASRTMTRSPGLSQEQALLLNAVSRQPLL